MHTRTSKLQARGKITGLKCPNNTMPICTAHTRCTFLSFKSLGFELCKQDPSLKHATSRAALLAEFGNACRAPWAGAPPKQSLVTLKTPQWEGLRGTRWCRRRQTKTFVEVLSFCLGTLFHKSVKYHRVVCGSLSMTVELRTRERAVGRIKDLKEALVKSENRVQKQKFMTRWSANRFNTFQRMHCNFQNGQSFYCFGMNSGSPATQCIKLQKTCKLQILRW
jgi:hypothetical protein